jgi:hypothetical protein
VIQVSVKEFRARLPFALEDNVIDFFFVGKGTRAEATMQETASLCMT